LDIITVLGRPSMHHPSPQPKELLPLLKRAIREYGFLFLENYGLSLERAGGGRRRRGY
jgi:hypothetical protein